MCFRKKKECMSSKRKCFTWCTWLVIFMCFLLVGCVPRGTITSTRDSVFIERTIERHDTEYMVAPDTAALRLLVECDSNNNAILAMLESERGERINASAKAKNTGGALMVDVECGEDSLRVLVEQLRETIRTMSAHNEVQVVKEKYIPPFAKFTIWWFGITAAILLAIVAVKIYSRFFA